MKPGPKPKPRGPCLVEGCERISYSLGYCQVHYARQHRTGSFESTRRAPGSGTITHYGYLTYGAGGTKKLAHIIIAEKALGKPLPPGAEVHHWNEDKLDNRPENLVICPGRAYHFLLHQRMRALDACGHAGWRKCPFCLQYDDPINMKENKHGRHYYHRACRSKYRREYDQRNRARGE